MLKYFSSSKRNFTILAGYLLMEFLLMLFNGIDIVHLPTLLTLFYIPSTVPEVSGYLRLRIFFQAVIAFLHRLGHTMIN